MSVKLEGSTEKFFSENCMSWLKDARPGEIYFLVCWSIQNVTKNVSYFYYNRFIKK